MTGSRATFAAWLDVLVATLDEPGLSVRPSRAGCTCHGSTSIASSVRERVRRRAPRPAGSCSSELIECAAQLTARRRTLAVRALDKHGVMGLGWGDPIGWLDATHRA